jgi:hypothetical protein
LIAAGSVRHGQHDEFGMNSTTVITFLKAGLGGTVVSAIVLMGLGRVFAGSALAAFNATSHWLFGPAAASTPGFSLGVTGTGVLTHVVACFFWGAVLVALLLFTGVRRTVPVWLCALLVGMLALVIDYGLLPEQLSPGWHLVLPGTAVFAGFLALGAGLALGATLGRSRA